LTALLDGSHPALAHLRRQLEWTRVRHREPTGYGRFTDFWVDDQAGALDVHHRFSIDDVYGQVAGMESDTAFLLHIVRGRLKTLEAFAVGEAWPEPPVLRRTWYVAPDPADAGQLHPVDHRDLTFALRGLTAAEGDED
jgi:hypothetical protein